jgi:hypothetical protein
VGVSLIPQWIQAMQIEGVVYRPSKKPFGRIHNFVVQGKGEKLPLVEKLWNMLDVPGNL